MNLLSQLPPFAADAVRLSVWLILLTIIFVPLERLFGQAPAQRSHLELLNNLAYYFIASLLPALLLSVPMALVAVVAHQLVPATIPATLGALPLALKLLLAFLISEIGVYWGHRLSHQIPFLWRFHALHHSAGHMYFLVNTRMHPVDSVVTRLFGLVPLYVLGLVGANAAGGAILLLISVIGSAWGFFVHANLRWRFGPFEQLLSTPAFHHWHHSRVDHINRNYASMLPLLDRVFGSYYLPPHWPAEVGIEATTPPKLGSQLLEPLLPAKKTAPQAPPHETPQ